MSDPILEQMQAALLKDQEWRSTLRSIADDATIVSEGVWAANTVIDPYDLQNVISGLANAISVLAEHALDELEGER